MEQKQQEGFWNANGAPNTSQKTRRVLNNNQKRTCDLADFVDWAVYIVKIKENEKKNIDINWELKKKTVEL